MPPLLIASFGFVDVWTIIMAGIALIWLKRHIDVNRGQREPVLSEHDAAPDAALPALSMLVAGKEEEANIERCLRGLFRQNYPDAQFIAVNDRSTDRTGEILDRLAAQEPRLTALHVRDLPDGWFGKNNAMRLGVEQARGAWLAFTDADCTFDSEQLLAAAVSFAQRHGIEFLSVLPRLETQTFWERVVQPVAGAILVYWNPPQKVNDPRSSCAYANGAFMLMTRAAYERIGGHAAVKATLNEDMHFARLAKRAGVPFRVIRGHDLYRVRMYENLGQIWRGWSRIFYGCFGTLPRLIASFLLLSLASLSPYITVIAAALTGAWWCTAAAGAAVVAQQSILWRFYALSGLPSWYAITYPLGTVFALGMTLNAMTRALGATQTNWRGTVYRGGH